jgi:hypothetical protein
MLGKPFGGDDLTVRTMMPPAPLLRTDRHTTPDVERLRKDLMSATFTLSTAFQHDPDSFRVRVTEALVSNDRTGRTANFIVREGTVGGVGGADQTGTSPTLAETAS